jgi:trimeric autotransporter adhesin
MSGYTRQSAADIIPTATVRAAPINNELNAIRDTFAFDGTGVTGHKHDGSSDEGSYVPLIADVDGNNKVVVDTANNRVGVFTEVSSAPVEQVRIQDGVIVPVADNDIDLGTSSVEFKNLYLDGTAKIDTLTVDENATVAGTLGVTGLSTLASADINAGTIDGTVIGAASAQAITGTLITASTGFSGTLTGNVTGNLTGNSAGTHTGPVIGNVTGNVTSTGTSSFANVTIDGSLNMNSGTSATVTGLSTPVDPSDAATKNYVDTSISNLIDSAPSTLDTLNELAAALGDDPSFATTITNSIATKLPLAGGTMSGAIAMGSNKVTGLGNPTSAQDAATKTYVDTADALKLNLTGGTMTGNIVMGANKVTSTATPTTDDDLTRKAYVDSILGSATAAATSAAAALVSETNASTSETNAATSETNAAASASAASTSASNAASSASAASTSASNAATSETNAATSETNAAASETAAATSASNAATSESNASASASAASTSEGNAAASESAAATSASNAATSEGNAATSEANAAASYDAFDDRYLGAKASAPTLDNDGNALLTGALYWNTSSEALFIWTGSVWSAAAFDTSGALVAINNLSDVQDAATARANLGISDITVLDNKTSAYTVVSGDLGKTIYVTGDGTFAISLTSAATLGSGFNVKIWNTGDGTITINPAGAEYIDSATGSPQVLYAYEGIELVSNGTNWYRGTRRASLYYAENANDAAHNPPVASGTYSFAIGAGATSSGNVSLALGGNVTASGAGSTAIGRASANLGAVAAGSGSVALNGSHASGLDSVAAGIGTNNVTYGATGSNSIAMGQLAKATNLSGTAIGTNAIASADYSTALGYGSNATGSGAVALGASTASGDAALASIGANASGFYSVALGESSAASGTNSIAIGTSASSTVANQIALGGATDTVKISNTYTLPTTDGTTGQVLTTDGSGAVTFADAASFELYAENPVTPTAPSATGANAVAIGFDADASNTHNIAIGYRSEASTGTYNFAFGNRATANASYYAVAIGCTTGGLGSIAGGNGSFATSGGVTAGDHAQALGRSYASGTDSFAAAIANNTASYGATGANSVAIGQLAKASGQKSFSLGYSAEASGTYSYSLGRQAQATQEGSVALGSFAKSGIAGKVAIGGYSPNNIGDSQAGILNLYSDTTGDTPEALTTNNSAAGTTNQIILPNNSAYAFSGTIVARQQASAGTACAAWKIEGLIRREGSAGTTVLVNSATTVLDNTPAWGMALTADVTNGGLAITVTGAAATNIRWVATINTSEVTY